MDEPALRDGAALEPQFRSFHIGRNAIDEEKRTVDISFSSEEPVKRWFGREVLDHGPGSADLARLNDGGAVLFEHDPAQQIGVVEEARIDSDKVGRARVRFSRNAKAQEVFQDIVDGIRSKISFGYRIREADVVERDEEQGDLYRVSSWEALEISTVSIPADATVGVGRSDKISGNEAPVKLASPNNTKTDTNMNTNEAAEVATEQVRSVPAQPAASPEPKVDVDALRKEERERIREINAIGSRFGLSDDQVQSAISSGTGLDQFRAHVVENFKPAPAAPIADGPSHELGLSRKEKKAFSIRKAIFDIRTGRGLQGIEKEVSDATADQLDLERSDLAVHLPFDITGDGRRDLEAGVASEGGELVATGLGSMIDILRNRMVVMQAGAQQLTGLRGNLNLPKLTTAGTCGWVDEEGSATESTQAFGQVALTPSRLSARTVYSDQLVRQSSISVENMIREDLMRVMAIELDRTAIHGSGVAPEPSGVEQASGLNTVTFTTSATFAKMLDFEELIAVDNADTSSMTWITTPVVRAAWKAITKDSGSGQFLWDSDNTVNGYNALVSNQIAGDKVVLGDWNSCIIASWGSMSVIVDPYSKAQTGQSVVTLSSFHDIGIRHGESFCFSTDSGAL